jgi:hypothetical protein
MRGILTLSVRLGLSAVGCLAQSVTSCQMPPALPCSRDLARMGNPPKARLLPPDLRLCASTEWCQRGFLIVNRASTYSSGSHQVPHLVWLLNTRNDEYVAYLSSPDPARMIIPTGGEGFNNKKCDSAASGSS